MPQTTTFYDTLPLVLVARTKRETLGLVLLSEIGMVLSVTLMAGPADDFVGLMAADGRLAVLACYLPALVLVMLRGPNECDAPGSR